MNPSLAIYPLLTALSTLIVLALIVVPTGFLLNHFTPFFHQFAHLSENQEPTFPRYMYLIFLGFGLITQWTVVMANATFFVASDSALQGEKITVREAFARVWTKRGPLTFWALFSFTIGQIIRLIGEKLGIFGRITQFLGGIAWSLATVFAIPTVTRHGTGPIQTIKDSANLFKRAWGESLIANFSLGLYSLLLIFATIIGGGLLFGLLGTLGILTVLTAIGLGALMLLVMILGSIYIESLSQIYKAALYRYAETGDYVGPFTPDMFENAFRSKKKTA